MSSTSKGSVTRALSAWLPRPEVTLADAGSPIRTQRGTDALLTHFFLLPAEVCPYKLRRGSRSIRQVAPDDGR